MSGNIFKQRKGQVNSHRKTNALDCIAYILAFKTAQSDLHTTLHVLVWRRLRNFKLSDTDD